MNRSRILLVAGVLGIAAGTLWLARSRGGHDVPHYLSAPVAEGDLTATVSATGSVRPVVQVQVGTQVSGTISELHADYNSRVRAGQLLAQIEPSSFKTRVVQAEAAVARADAALKDARRQFARTQELEKGNFVSQADVDAAESTVDQRNADLQEAQAQLAAARLDLEHTTIRSPIDGVVISRSVDVGQTVAASLQAPQLFVIANDLAQMQVEARIDEADIGRIRPGLPVTFSVDAFPDITFQGSVSQVRLEPITDQNVVTYTTVMGTRNDDLRLRPGMTANVTVLVETRTGVLKVPNAALRFRPEGGKGNGARGGAVRSADAAPAGGASPGRSHRPGRGAGLAAVGEAQAEPAEARGGPAGAHRAAGAASALRTATEAPERAGEIPLKPGSLYVLRDGRPTALQVLTGITDGKDTEVHGDQLRQGDLVVVGVDLGGAAHGQALQPPPGMGAPQFRPGGRR